MDSVNIRPMLDYLEDQVSAEQMRGVIDEVLFEYIDRKIEQEESGNSQHITQNIYLLRGLRDVFARM